MDRHASFMHLETANSKCANFWSTEDAAMTFSIKTRKIPCILLKFSNIMLSLNISQVSKRVKTKCRSRLNKVVRIWNSPKRRNKFREMNIFFLLQMMMEIWMKLWFLNWMTFLCKVTTMPNSGHILQILTNCRKLTWKKLTKNHISKK